MELLQHHLLWDMSRTRQAELLDEAQRAQLVRLLPRKQSYLWTKLTNWWRRRPRLELPPSVSPELG